MDGEHAADELPLLCLELGVDTDATLDFNADADPSRWNSATGINAESGGMRSAGGLPEAQFSEKPPGCSDRQESAADTAPPLASASSAPIRAFTAVDVTEGLGHEASPPPLLPLAAADPDQSQSAGSSAIGVQPPFGDLGTPLGKAEQAQEQQQGGGDGAKKEQADRGPGGESADAGDGKGLGGGSQPTNARPTGSGAAAADVAPAAANVATAVDANINAHLVAAAPVDVADGADAADTAAAGLSAASNTAAAAGVAVAASSAAATADGPDGADVAAHAPAEAAAASADDGGAASAAATVANMDAAAGASANADASAAVHAAAAAGADAGADTDAGVSAAASPAGAVAVYAAGDGAATAAAGVAGGPGAPLEEGQQQPEREEERETQTEGQAGATEGAGLEAGPGSEAGVDAREQQEAPSEDELEPERADAGKGASQRRGSSGARDEEQVERSPSGALARQRLLLACPPPRAAAVLATSRIVGQAAGRSPAPSAARKAADSSGSGGGGAATTAARAKARSASDAAAAAAAARLATARGRSRRASDAGGAASVAVGEPAATGRSRARSTLDADAAPAAAKPSCPKTSRSSGAAKPAPSDQRFGDGGADDASGPSACVLRCVSCGAPYRKASRRVGFFAHGSRAFTCNDCCQDNKKVLGFYGPRGTHSLEEAGGRACEECGTSDTAADNRWFRHRLIVGAYTCRPCDDYFRRRARYPDLGRSRGGDAASASPGAGDPREPHTGSCPTGRAVGGQAKEVAPALPVAEAPAKCAAKRRGVEAPSSGSPQKPKRQTKLEEQGPPEELLQGVEQQQPQAEEEQQVQGKGQEDQQEPPPLPQPVQGRGEGEGQQASTSSCPATASTGQGRRLSPGPGTRRSERVKLARAGQSPGSIGGGGGDVGGDGGSHGTHTTAAKPQAEARLAVQEAAGGPLAILAAAAGPLGAETGPLGAATTLLEVAGAPLAEAGAAREAAVVLPEVAAASLEAAAATRTVAAAALLAEAAAAPLTEEAATPLLDEAATDLKEAAAKPLAEEAAETRAEEAPPPLTDKTAPPVTAEAAVPQEVAAAPIVLAAAPSAQATTAATEATAAVTEAPATTPEATAAPSHMPAITTAAVSAAFAVAAAATNMAPGAAGMETGPQQDAPAGLIQVPLGNGSATQRVQSLPLRRLQRQRLVEQVGAADGLQPEEEQPVMADQLPQLQSRPQRSGGQLEQDAGEQQQLSQGVQQQSTGQQQPQGLEGQPPQEQQLQQQQEAPQPQPSCITCGSPFPGRRRKAPSGFFTSGTLAYTCHSCCLRNRNTQGYYGPAGTRSLEEAGGRACSECGATDERDWRLHPSLLGLYMCMSCFHKCKKVPQKRRLDAVDSAGGRQATGQDAQLVSSLPAPDSAGMQPGPRKSSRHHTSAAGAGEAEGQGGNSQDQDLSPVPGIIIAIDQGDPRVAPGRDSGRPSRASHRVLRVNEGLAEATAAAAVTGAAPTMVAVTDAAAALLPLEPSRRRLLDSGAEGDDTDVSNVSSRSLQQRRQAGTTVSSPSPDQEEEEVQVPSLEEAQEHIDQTQQLHGGPQQPNLEQQGTSLSLPAKQCAECGTLTTKKWYRHKHNTTLSTCCRCYACFNKHGAYKPRDTQGLMVVGTSHAAASTVAPAPRAVSVVPAVAAAATAPAATTAARALAVQVAAEMAVPMGPPGGGAVMSGQGDASLTTSAALPAVASGTAGPPPPRPLPQGQQLSPQLLSLLPSPQSSPLQQQSPPLLVLQLQQQPLPPQQQEQQQEQQQQVVTGPRSKATMQQTAREPAGPARARLDGVVTAMVAGAVVAGLPAVPPTPTVTVAVPAPVTAVTAAPLVAAVVTRAPAAAATGAVAAMAVAAQAGLAVAGSVVEVEPLLPPPRGIIGERPNPQVVSLWMRQLEDKVVALCQALAEPRGEMPVAGSVGLQQQKAAAEPLPSHEQEGARHQWQSDPQQPGPGAAASVGPAAATATPGPSEVQPVVATPTLASSRQHASTEQTRTASRAPRYLRLADLIYRWMASHVWPRPLALMLGPAAAAIALDREGPLPDRSALEQASWDACRADVCEGFVDAAGVALGDAQPPRGVTAAAVRRFRIVAAALAEDLASQLAAEGLALAAAADGAWALARHPTGRLMLAAAAEGLRLGLRLGEGAGGPGQLVVRLGAPGQEVEMEMEAGHEQAQGQGQSGGGSCCAICGGGSNPAEAAEAPLPPRKRPRSGGAAVPGLPPPPAAPSAAVGMSHWVVTPGVCWRRRRCGGAVTSGAGAGSGAGGGEGGVVEEAVVVAPRLQAACCDTRTPVLPPRPPPPLVLI